MLELNVQAKVNVDDLWKALDLLREDLIAKTDKEMRSFDHDGEIHDELAAKIQGLIEEFANQFRVFSQEMKLLVESGEVLASNYQLSQQSLAEAQGSLTKVK